MDNSKAFARFEDLLRSVDHAATSTTKYREFEKFLGNLLEISPESIYTTHVAKPGNFDVRMTQSTRARNAQLKVALLPNEADLEFVIDPAIRIVRERNPGSAVLLVCDGPQGWQPRWGIEPTASGKPPLGLGNLARIVRWVPSFDLKTYQSNLPEPAPPPQSQLAADGIDLAQPRRPQSPIAAIPLILDDRIRRMLRNAIASSKAIMLVGPPGTGKSTLVEQTVAAAAAEPKEFGLTYSHGLSVVTPDESWTTRDLVGGTSVNSAGNLEFAPGHVLQAIAADEWLLLDEANRADLDRIFGGILTWLAGQEVTVGRHPTSGSEIMLAWSEHPRSNYFDEEAYDGHPARTVYRAGQEWRLIGTYNSLDAHRVFRLGIALGRRFAQIPVPPPSPAMFREIAQERVKDEFPAETGQRLADAIARIYEIHAARGTVALGPALFLSIPAYVEAGLKWISPDNTEELIAEAYLGAFGTWLVRLEDDTLSDLGAEMSQDDALGAQWGWVHEQLRNLA